MLKIRFQRTGRTNDPSFRIVVVEHTASPKAGKNVAQVGSHHPKTKQTLIDGEAAKLWLSRGAKASGTVHNLFVSKGIIEGKKVNVLQRKSPPQKEEEAKAKAEGSAPIPEAPAESAPAEAEKADISAEASIPEGEQKEEAPAT